MWNILNATALKKRTEYRERSSEYEYYNGWKLIIEHEQKN